MRIALALTVALIVVAFVIFAYRFAMKDAMSMYSYPKKPAEGESRHDRRINLLSELAALDQQIADAERITASTCDDATLKRATEILAEAREIRREVKRKLNGP